MQRRAVIRILKAFWTSPSFGIKVIVGLTIIHMYLHKLRGRAQLRAHILPNNYILRSLLKTRTPLNSNLHHLSLNSLTPCQKAKIRGIVINMDNRFNEVFLVFDPLNKEFSPGLRIINSFTNHFSFHPFKKSSRESLKSHLLLLDDLTISSSLDSSYTLVVTDASIKNNVATSIAHIYICNRDIIKIIHYAVNILFLEAELFTIRYVINQATNVLSILKIIVIIDSLHTTRRIFDLSLYSYQIYVAAIFKELRRFFIKNNNNSIEFWKCPSCCKWSLHKAVDMEFKHFYSQLFVTNFIQLVSPQLVDWFSQTKLC